jgi:hypothetical protein
LVALESFTNEDNQIRFKDRHLGRVLAAIDHLQPKLQDQLIAELSASVDAGAPKDWVDQDDFESAVESLNAYAWAAPLVASLKAKSASLTAEEENA